MDHGVAHVGDEGGAAHFSRLEPKVRDAVEQPFARPRMMGSKAVAGFAPRVQQHRFRGSVAVDEARHRDAGAEREVADFGVQRFSVRRGL
ncbi:hypothetical protein AU252_05400 [Pseudarthrobacter sulfonivorans]|uniref:Uncharacterized protein n=1 Tax=Pseudarthrobacter sulfonivorans TaxID=121292 RepID=A0A0U3Q266_9MICC|nr:hypothetical protein [Pseudarthrobacter sulfonivorans]ALV40670.1 hypothetical protein AU252_05400 [Pseudarthrobacter sulfonivorans]